MIKHNWLILFYFSEEYKKYILDVQVRIKTKPSQGEKISNGAK
jgi:hypothetical protein